MSRRLTVLVDAIQYRPHITGTDRSARNILDQLGQLAPDIDWRVLVHADYGYITEVVHGRGMTALPLPERQRFRWSLASLERHARHENADAIVGFHNLVGPVVGRTPAVISALDLIPFSVDAGYFPSAALRRAHRTNAWAVARHARRIVAISHYTKRAVVDTLGVRPDKVAVGLLQADPRFRPVPERERARIRDKYALPAEYVLAIGGSEPRKNNEALINAHRSLPEPLQRRFPLVIAGGFWADQPPPRRDEAQWLGYVDDDDLPALYAGATVFAFVSLLEGFGLPVLEAMAAGAPVICSNATSLPEVAGDAALLVDPRKPEDIAGALRRLLSGDALRSCLVERGAQQVSRFSWRRAAEIYLDQVHAVVGRT